jgi:uncharacterized protein
VMGERGSAWVTVKLDAIAQAVDPGHRLRVAISTAYWPWAWPSPEPVTLTLHAARLHLPLRTDPDRAQDDALAPFEHPETAEPLAVETIEPSPTNRTHTHDVATGAHELRFQWDVGGHRRLVEAQTEMLDTNVTSYRIVDGDPLSAEVRVLCTTGLGRGADWQTRIDTDSRMTATRTEFLVTQRVDAYEGDALFRSRTWELRFPRDGV